MDDSHYKSVIVRFPLDAYCLVSHRDSYVPWCGSSSPIPAHVIPADLPQQLLETESSVEDFAMKPEQALTNFLEANPKYLNPRDIGRILFHTPGLSPYGIALILFNSQYSSKALIFSFISSIDLDYISIIDSIKVILQKTAIPTNEPALKHFSSAFGSAYSLRNQLEWPDPKLVADIIMGTMLSLILGKTFIHCFKNFNISEVMVKQINEEVKEANIPMYVTSLPVHTKVDESLVSEVEQEGRYRSSWHMSIFRKEGSEIKTYETKDLKTCVSKIKLEDVKATQKFGNSKKPYLITLTKNGNQEFGEKLKDGNFVKSTRKSFVLSFKTEEEMLKWISAINIISVANITKSIL